MANQSKSNVATKQGMSDPTSFDARSGAAKKAQTKFGIAGVPGDKGMRSRSEEVGVAAGINPATGYPAMDADPANVTRTDVMSPQPKAKNLGKQGQILQAKWDMKDANGNGVDSNMAGRVLGEAILSGSTRLPGAVALKTDSGARPSPYPARDPN